MQVPPPQQAKTRAPVKGVLVLMRCLLRLCKGSERDFSEPEKDAQEKGDDERPPVQEEYHRTQRVDKVDTRETE